MITIIANLVPGIPRFSAQTQDICGMSIIYSSNFMTTTFYIWTGFTYTIPLLNMIFVNPFSQTDTKWIIYPFTHNRIADHDSLDVGLRSLAASVEPLGKDEANSNIS